MNVVRDTPFPADAETGADTEKSNSECDTEILNVAEEQVEDVSNMVALEERIVELDEGQARSNPGKTPESRPLPERVLMEEDQTGSNPGQSHVVQARPNPEPMHKDFVATVYPQVHESLKLTTEEHVHLENPPSSSGTLSSMKNLDDAFTFVDSRSKIKERNAKGRKKSFLIEGAAFEGRRERPQSFVSGMIIRMNERWNGSEEGGKGESRIKGGEKELLWMNLRWKAVGVHPGTVKTTGSLDHLPEKVTSSLVWHAVPARIVYFPIMRMLCDGRSQTCVTSCSRAPYLCKQQEGSKQQVTTHVTVLLPPPAAPLTYNSTYQCILKLMSNTRCISASLSAVVPTIQLRKTLLSTAAGAYNQGGNSYQPQGASHVQNPPSVYQAPAHQALGYQAPVHQAPIPQPQVVTTTEFINYMKANDAILKNMQTNMTSLRNSNIELKNMFGQFMKMNTASSSGSGTLPSNTIINPREDLEHETEVTKDMVPPTNNGSTKDVQSPVVQVETQVPNSEPVVAPVIKPVEAPVSALKPNLKPSIPYPSRLNDQKLREKANNQMEKFFQIFQDLHFDISFADALILMPKFA
ncbi:hypothetical protein Tco_0829530 [Tanacetum coccineum]